jgi:hypothetical protein
VKFVLVKGTYDSEDDQNLLEATYDLLVERGHEVKACDNVWMNRQGEVRDLVDDFRDYDGFFLCSALRKFQDAGNLKAQETRKILEDGVLAAATLLRWMTQYGVIKHAGLVVILPTPPTPQSDMLPWVIAEGALRALSDVTPNMSILTIPRENLEFGLDTQMRSWK